ncbi:MAG: tRNA uridine-5-carboxymethylaminomethyl(34) synthesis enzyme MnmG [bacterium]
MNKFDCIVVGGGHAGCEAALAASRMGLNTLMLTLNLDTIGQLSCNPSMGGLGKSQLIFEVDALGGEIGFVSDIASIGYRVLNTKKGLAVQSLRAQVDRKKYRETMQKIILNTENLYVQQGEATEIIVSKKGTIKSAIGVVSASGMEYFANTIIITTGTFLKGLIHIGLKNYPSGRMGELPSTELSDSLKKLGFQLGRLKTGTSARVDIRTIDFDKMIEQSPDKGAHRFSHRTKKNNPTACPCYITHTNMLTQKIILQNLKSSPLYSGIIKGIGARYCPSIEDKCVRFKEKTSHQVFIEPDGVDTNECYLNGVSTSLPEAVQLDFLHTIPGLEKVRIIRPGYAIEYDFVLPVQVYPSLETKIIKNLYLAGQILGTSGYEEAASQGIITGINAALKVKGKPQFILPRYEAYIGVLTDDLSTKEILEPYRMFTSRVEHRLILPEHNADERLMKYGLEFGLIPKKEYNKTQKLVESVKVKLRELKSTQLKPESINPVLKENDSMPITKSSSAFQILKRPEIKIEMIEQFIEKLTGNEKIRLEFLVKYEGYIKREYALVKKFNESESYEIPQGFDFYKVNGLSREACEKLSKIKPVTLEQAKRIGGVRSADIIRLFFTLKKSH